MAEEWRNGINNMFKKHKIEAHHGMIVHKVLMAPLWRFTRLKKSFVNIQERHVVTLLAITKVKRTVNQTNKGITHPWGEKKKKG